MANISKFMLNNLAHLKKHVCDVSDKGMSRDTYEHFYKNHLVRHK